MPPNRVPLPWERTTNVSKDIDLSYKSRLQSEAGRAAEGTRAPAIPFPSPSLCGMVGAEIGWMPGVVVEMMVKRSFRTNPDLVSNAVGVRDGVWGGRVACDGDLALPGGPEGGAAVELQRPGLLSV